MKLSKQLAVAYQQIEMLNRDAEQAAKACWIMHALLGFPKLRNGETYYDTCTRVLAKKLGSKINVKKLMQKDSIAVARFIAMLDPGTPDDRRREMRRDKRARQRALSALSKSPALRSLSR